MTVGLTEGLETSLVVLVGAGALHLAIGHVRHGMAHRPIVVALASALAGALAASLEPTAHPLR